MKADEIRRILEASPLAAPVDEILKLARPAVRMRTYLVETDRLAPGASRMGGAPDLPPGFAWPENRGRPIEFLAQIDFAAAARALKLDGLPERGWLVLFADIQAQYDGAYDEPGLWQARYFEADPASLARTEQPGEPAELFNLCEVEFEREDSLPELQSIVGDGFHEDEGETWKICRDLDEQIAECVDGEPVHRIGGYPMLIQSTLDEYQGLAFLLQLDSDYEVGWMWGDAGRVYYWIEPDDLAARAFEKIRGGDEFY